MKGFGIYVKNNLLEPKHYQNMESAIWLYLWLLDKMTSVNENGVGKVLGNQPVTYEMVYADLGMPTRTYRRWVDRLREHGYINTVRTPKGLCIVVNKAEKIFKKGSAKSTHHSTTDVPNGHIKNESDVPKVKSDVPKSLREVPNQHIQYKTIQDNTKDNTILPTVGLATLDPLSEVTNFDVLDVTTTDPLISNALKPSVTRNQSNPDVDSVVRKFEDSFGLRLKRIRQQRATAFNLVRRYSLPSVLSAIDAAVAVRDMRYAPQILNLEDLWEKWDKLEAYFRKSISEQNSKVSVITEDG